MKVDYRRHMKKSGYTIEATAMDLDLSVRQVMRYLNGEAPVPDDKALELAHLYQSPELPFEQLGNHNPIGRKLCPAPLNNIDRSFTAMYYKLLEEQTEMTDAMDEMCRLTLNHRHLDQEDAEHFDQLINQVIDMEQLCLEIKIEYARVRGLKALEERINSHRRKCNHRGYHIEKEKPALVRERIAKIYTYRDYTTVNQRDKDLYCEICGAEKEVFEEPAVILSFAMGSIVEHCTTHSYLACPNGCGPDHPEYIPGVLTDDSKVPF